MGRPAEEILFGTKKHIQDVCPRRGRPLPISHKGTLRP
jgi:hypothetical protein